MPIAFLGVNPGDLGVVNKPSEVKVRIWNPHLRPVDVVTPPVLGGCTADSNTLRKVAPLTSIEVAFPVHFTNQNPGHHIGTVHVRVSDGADQITFVKEIPYQIQ
ncbi:hypothetical protein OP10G_2538 [Fimbriimonas ginsengisoli Gsoil 348]|uniref:Uncharacterized protein n=1 Tax=Fimbriimonas ginsengisoli Gsoil 348 TaxID=661478 RepID=A0A068NR39_FIMGI|nr:hypothetical protein OP10G_2538 [Fimbriimonas ginsengisoli Gsoil 348]